MYLNRQGSCNLKWKFGNLEKNKVRFEKLLFFNVGIASFASLMVHIAETEELKKGRSWQQKMDSQTAKSHKYCCLKVKFRQLFQTKVAICNYNKLRFLLHVFFCVAMGFWEYAAVLSCVCESEGEWGWGSLLTHYNSLSLSHTHIAPATPTHKPPISS